MEKLKFKGLVEMRDDLVLTNAGMDGASGLIGLL